MKGRFCTARRVKISAMLPQKLLKELRAALPPGGVLTSEQETIAYETDGLLMFRQRPPAVALPQTREQVAKVLALCKAHNTPVVARGAGTGLSGGALPHKDGVLLNCAKMKRILEIDAETRTARVEPGVINLSISQAAAAAGLYYAPDPSSQSACSIGGNIAENSGGVHCLKYGLTVHNVLSITIATIDGELVTLGSAGEDAPGYDLTALFVGSEGMLGVAVEATVKLLPVPPQTEVMLAAFDTLDDCAAAVAGVIARGIIPAGLEMMDNPAIRAVEDFVHAGYPREAAAVLVCELDGHSEDVARDGQAVREVFRQHRASHIITAADEAHKAKLWAGRKACFPAIGRLAPDYYCMDGTIPRRQLAQVLRTIGELSAQYGLGVANVFHAGDGNLHPLIMYDAADAQSKQKAEQFGNDILRTCVAAGGTVTGEHGVGVEKLDAMCAQFPPAELEQFFRVRAAFDPQGLMNPGKAIPVLSRCSELGGMHVHGGHLAHADIPRF